MLLNKQNLQIAELAGKGSRYAFQAIQVTPQRTAVTNGHYLVMVSLPKAEDSHFPGVEGFTPSNESTPEFLLSKEVALEVAKAIPSETTIPILKHAAIGATETDISLAVTDLDTPKVFRQRKVEGKFPNVDAVIPDSAQTKLKIGFSAEYLMKLCKSAITTCNDCRAKNVTIQRMGLQATPD